MELIELIETLSALSGPSGQEDRLHGFLRQQLERLCDHVETDAMGNLIGVRSCGKSNAKKVLLDAHLDEVGLIVTGIERGFLRVSALGGIDARILPATEVLVLTEPPIPGVIDTMPPHALRAEEMEKAVPIEKLVIDVGMTQEESEQAVPLGTAVTFCTQPRRLLGGKLCGKSLDNRAGAAILLRVLEHLRDETLDFDLYAMFSTQEELGMRGAGAGVYGIAPDLALVLDVTHGKTPDAKDVTLMDLGKGPAIGVGPNMTRCVTQALQETAEREKIPFQFEVMSGSSGTNAWPIQIACGGIPVGVLSLPLRYMHTPHEVIDLQDACQMAELTAAFVRRAGEVLI